MYFVISIILIISIGLISFLKVFSNFRQKYNDFYNYFITIVSIFLGAFIAIHLNNKAEESKERAKVERFLVSSSEELNSIIIEVEAIQEYTIDENKNIKIFLSRNHPSSPTLLPMIIHNEYIMKYLHEKTLRVLNSEIRNLNTFYRKLSNVHEIMTLDNERLYLMMDEYLKELKLTVNLLRIEGLY